MTFRDAINAQLQSLAVENDCRAILHSAQGLFWVTVPGMPGGGPDPRRRRRVYRTAARYRARGRRNHREAKRARQAHAAAANMAAASAFAHAGTATRAGLGMVA